MAKRRTKAQIMRAVERGNRFRWGATGTVLTVQRSCGFYVEAHSDRTGAVERFALVLFESWIRDGKLEPLGKAREAA